MDLYTQPSTLIYIEGCVYRPNNACPICKENYKLDDNKLNNFLKSGINNNKIQNNDNTQNNNEIEAHNNNENTTIINNNVINLII